MAVSSQKACLQARERREGWMEENMHSYENDGEGGGSGGSINVEEEEEETYALYVSS